MESTRTTRGTGQRETGQSSRPSQNTSNGPNGRPAGSASQGRSPTWRHFWLQWLIYIVIINLLFSAPLIFSSLSGQQPTITLSYISFLQQVERLMTQAHQQARSVLTEHCHALDRLAQALLQEEVLERNQVLAIVHGVQNTQNGAGSEQATQKTLMAGS